MFYFLLKQKTPFKGWTANQREKFITYLFV